MSKKLRTTIWEMRQEIPILEKGTTGFKFKYTDLKVILDTVEPLLKKYGLAYDHQTIIVGGGKNGLRTSIFDTTTGEDFVNEMIIPEGVVLGGMNGYQVLGSALTYFRRYTLLVALGILTGDDVDILKQEKPAQKVKTDYVKKIENLIGLGRKRSQLENYFNSYSDKMSQQEQDKIVKLISSVN